MEHVVATTTLNLTGDDEEIGKRVEMGKEMFDIYENLDFLNDFSLPRRGDIQIELLSPSGTKSILLHYRDYDLVPYASL